MLYVLQEGVPAGYFGWDDKPRVFLDDHLHAGCVELQRIDAKDWPTARAQLPDFGTLKAGE